MRGKLDVIKNDDRIFGITPADAGKTETAPTVTLNAEDHPRGCGENLLMQQKALQGEGSPPRMRGKLRRRKCFAAFSRITPADAGKTYLRYYLTFYDKDHPRGCGENATRDKLVSEGTGSPPRMRGKLKKWEDRSHPPRITPADAGKTNICGYTR